MFRRGDSMGSGDDEGTMLISWTASDRNLLGNSVTLKYSLKPDGPWETVVTGYKNEGLYRWAVPSNLAGTIHLRMEASDRAGNIGRFDLASPVAVETGKQRVRVIGIGPAK